MTTQVAITRDAAGRLIGGKCSDLDPELFFPPSMGTLAFEEAATVCHSCPVKRECLSEARARGERFGVWGGVNFERNPNAEPFDPTTRVHCGTYAGVKRHRRRKETVCGPCRAAAVDYDRLVRDKRAELSRKASA